MTNYNPNFKYASLFLDELDMLSKRDSIGSIYGSIFSLIPIEKLEEEIEYWHNVYLGKDEYYGEEGKENFFLGWHKSVRQTDYIDGLHAYKIVNRLTDEQTKELDELDGKLKNLKRKVIYHPEGDWSDEDSKKHSESYRNLYEMDEYKSIQNKRKSLIDIKNTKDTVLIGGMMDSILWNTVHLDKENHLMKTFLRTFKRIELEKELVEIGKK
jgi:hypothetical protein